MILPGLKLQLAAAQVDLHIRELDQEKVVFVAGLQVRALITVLQIPALGADSDGTVTQALPVFAAGALPVGQKPLQPFPEFRQIETLRSREAVNPDIGPDLVQVPFQSGNRLQQPRVAQLAIIAQTAITLSHDLSPARALSCQLLLGRV
jgi:hypothetical protein